MADTAAKRDTETQLDRIEELARVMSRQFKEFRQELDRIRRLLERITDKD